MAKKQRNIRSLLRYLAQVVGTDRLSETTALEVRIQAAESAQLERWLERILTAKSPDELFD